MIKEKVAIQYTISVERFGNGEGVYYIENNAGYPRFGQGVASTYLEGKTDEEIIKDQTFVMDNFGVAPEPGVYLRKTGTLVPRYKGNKTEILVGL